MQSTLKVQGSIEAAIAKVKSRVSQHALSVGIFADATNSQTGERIAPYAAANEFGTATIPPRPFMRLTIADKQDEWAAILNHMFSNPGGQYIDAHTAFTALGETMVNDIIMTIQNGVYPANAPETVARKTAKGSADPSHTLVDTGEMQRAITYRVDHES